VLTPAGADLDLRVIGLPIYDPLTDTPVAMGDQLARFARLTRQPDSACAILLSEG